MFWGNVTMVIPVMLNAIINAGHIPTITNMNPSVNPIIAKMEAMIVLITKKSPKTMREYPRYNGTKIAIKPQAQRTALGKPEKLEI